MALAERKIYSNLPTSVGSGGVLTPNLLQAPSPPLQPHAFSFALAGTAVMPLVTIGTGCLGTGATDMLCFAQGSLSTVEWYPLTRHVQIASRQEVGAVWQRQLMRIKSDLQITMTDLARLLLVERPSVYQWFADAEPRQQNRERISTLADLAADWASLELGSIRMYMDSRSADVDHSLDELLLQQPLQIEAIEGMFGELDNARLLGQAAARAPLSDRLAARGFTPTDEATEARKRALAIRSTSPGEE